MENNLRQYLLEESYAMVKHLSAYGKEIPGESSSILSCTVSDLQSLDISDQEILKLHRVLSKKVAPARPKTIWLICKESHKAKWLNFMGPVGLVRRLMFTAIFSLIGFIAVSMSPEINFENIKSGIYALNGMKLLIVMVFLVTSASLGASFSNLFQANQYIVKTIYDSKYESSYWIRYVLGIIAGMMLAVVIPVPSGAEGNEAHFAVASRPMLAMLGGFSASLVYRILFRMVYAVESVFIGKQSEETDRKLAGLQTANDIELENGKQKYVSKLLQLQSLMSQGKSSDEIEEEMQKIISEINN